MIVIRLKVLLTKRAFVKREKKVKRANTRQDKEHDIRNIPLKKEGDDYEI